MSDVNVIQISVVIPFYQKKKGLLSKSLESIFLQSEVQYISEVIVVDDGSPSPAEPEISDVLSKYSNLVPVKLISQKNAGVSKARNVGLDSVSVNSTHIAFLDSDDTWLPEHIKFAVKAIKLGAKFYFSNFYQLNSKLPAFEKASNFNIASATSLDENIYRFDKCFVNQIVISNPVGTPTVVYEKSDTEHIKFDKKYRYAGEDYMMWVSLTRQLNNVYFCSVPTVVCGAGVNIFSGATWGSQQLSARIIDEIAYKRDMLNFPELTAEARALTTNKIESLRKSLIRNTISRLVRLKFAGSVTAVCAYLKR